MATPAHAALYQMAPDARIQTGHPPNGGTPAVAAPHVCTYTAVALKLAIAWLSQRWPTNVTPKQTR